MKKYGWIKHAKSVEEVLYGELRLEKQQLWSEWAIKMEYLSN